MICCQLYHDDCMQTVTPRKLADVIFKVHICTKEIWWVFWISSCDFFTNLTHCLAVLIYMCVILASPLIQEPVALSMGGPRACSTPSWGPVLRDPVHIIWFFMRLKCVWVSNSKIALTSRFLGIRAEWLWSQHCVLSGYSWPQLTSFCRHSRSVETHSKRASYIYSSFACCANSIGPSQRKFLWFWFFGCLWKCEILADD